MRRFNLAVFAVFVLSLILLTGCQHRRRSSEGMDPRMGAIMGAFQIL